MKAHLLCTGSRNRNYGNLANGRIRRSADHDPFAPREPLNQSAAALSGSFAPTNRFENLEIHKVFLRFPNLNLEQNPSLTALAIESEVP